MAYTRVWGRTMKDRPGNFENQKVLVDERLSGVEKRIREGQEKAKENFVFAVNAADLEEYVSHFVDAILKKLPRYKILKGSFTIQRKKVRFDSKLNSVYFFVKGETVYFYNSAAPQILFSIVDHSHQETLWKGGKKVDGKTVSKYFVKLFSHNFIKFSKFH